MLFVPLFFNGTMVRRHSIVPSLVTSIDQSFVRYMVSPTCTYSRVLSTYALTLTHLSRSTPTIVNALGHSPNYTQLLTVRSFSTPLIGRIYLSYVTRYRHTSAPLFSASFLRISVINTRTAG